jgi:hypothetical protein
MMQPAKTTPQHTIVHSPAFPWILLTHMLRSRPFIEKAASVIKPTDFNSVTERAPMLGIVICIQFWTKYREMLSKDMFFTQLGERLRGDPHFLSDPECHSLVQMVISAFQTPEDQMHVPFMVEQLQLFLAERRIKPMALAMSRASPEDTAKMVDEMSRMRQSTLITTGRVVDIFVPGKERFSMSARVPTGVNFFDYLTSGGIAYGEVVGLLGPFGRGKTTAAVQLACEFARTREYVAYLSYETDIEPGISGRMYGYIGGLSRSSVLGKRLEDIDPQMLATLRQASTAWAREYLLPIDMKQGGDKAGCNGPDEIRALLRELRDNGKHVRFVLIDQYLSMVQRYIAARNMDIGRDTRLIMQKMVGDLMDIAQPSDMDCCILALHQTAPECIKYSPVRVPNAADSAECRSWPFWMSTCLALGNPDNNSRQWAKVIKGRDVAMKECVVELDGENYKFLWDHTNPNRFRPGQRNFIDTMARDDDSVHIDRNPDTRTSSGNVPNYEMGL